MSERKDPPEFTPKTCPVCGGRAMNAFKDRENFTSFEMVCWDCGKHHFYKMADDKKSFYQSGQTLIGTKQRLCYSRCFVFIKLMTIPIFSYHIKPTVKICHIIRQSKNNMQTVTPNIPEFVKKWTCYPELLCSQTPEYSLRILLHTATLLQMQGVFLC